MHENALEEVEKRRKNETEEYFKKLKAFSEDSIKE